MQQVPVSVPSPVNFKDWMKQTDEAISRWLHGFTSENLPDCCYRDRYEDGLLPREAAIKAVRNLNSNLL